MLIHQKFHMFTDNFSVITIFYYAREFPNKNYDLQRFIMQR